MQGTTHLNQIHKTMQDQHMTKTRGIAKPALLSAFTLLAALMLLQGCAAPILSKKMEATYSTSLTRVDRTQKTEKQFGQNIILNNTNGGYSYSDDLIQANFNLSSSRVNFLLQNKTSNSVKILWDKAVFVDVSQESSGIAHKGTEFDTPHNQAPSIIPPQGNLSDFALPTSNILRSDEEELELDLVRPSSRTLPVVSSNNQDAIQAFKLATKAHQGKEFGLLLPLEAEGTVHEYTFWFKIDDVTVEGPS